MRDQPDHPPGVRIFSSVPTFQVEDVAATARWYAERLGFETMGTDPKRPPYSYASLQRDRAGARIIKPAAKTFWGGYAGYFQDPDGHLWEVVWNPSMLPS